MGFNSAFKGFRKKMTNMTKMPTLMVRVEDCIRMKLRRKMLLNVLNFHFVEYGITQRTKNSWMNPISCVMVLRIPTTVNDHTIRIFKRTILVVCALKRTLMD
jgi:hypothetical protein